MAGLVNAVSMFGLEEELTCSICLCLFQTPVTTPCGHNFCLPCLEMTWMEETFSCPQCRASFETRPELKKNTVLCKVVEQFQISQDGVVKGTDEEEKKADSRPAEPKSPLPVACDSCLVVDAAKTCLTCMASYCQEHLGPHLDSPAFKNHQLVPPVGELRGLTCQAHSKLLEFFCQDHRVSICCFCLLSHKTCATTPLKEAKKAKELQLKKRLTELSALNDKTAKSLEQVRAQQKQLSNTTSRRLDLLKSEFLEIVALIHEEEKNSWQKIKTEEKRVLDKFEQVHTVLGKKKNEIQKERDEIELTLAEMDDITFLKKSTKLQQIPFSDVFVPKIELDQNLLGAVNQKAHNLKEVTKRFLDTTQEEKKKEQRNRPAKRSESPKQRAQSCSKAETKHETTTLDTFLTKSREELLEFTFPRKHITRLQNFAEKPWQLRKATGCRRETQTASQGYRTSPISPGSFARLQDVTEKPRQLRKPTELHREAPAASQGYRTSQRSPGSFARLQNIAQVKLLHNLLWIATVLIRISYYSINLPNCLSRKRYRITDHTLSAF